jgi:hypothetical protein
MEIRFSSPRCDRCKSLALLSARVLPVKQLELPTGEELKVPMQLFSRFMLPVKLLFFLRPGSAVAELAQPQQHNSKTEYMIFFTLFSQKV